MKRPTPSDDPDPNFEVEITSLDELETPVHASNALLQGTHLAPRVRFWLTILSLVGGLLLIFMVLSPVVSPLLPKKASTPLTLYSPPIHVENVAVQNTIAYVSSSDGMWRTFRVKDGSLLWQRNFPGGTPIFINNTIYTYYYDQQSYTIQAIRISDGLPLWTFKTSSPGSIPVIIDRGVAYALSNSSFNRGPIQGQTLMALDASTGRELWQYNINVPAPSNIGVQVMQDEIYITVSSNDQTQKQALFVLRSSDGLPLWHYDDPSAQQTTSFGFLPEFSLPLTPNGLVYVTSINGTLNALNTENGHEIWHYTSTSTDSAEPPPMMGTHLFYVQTIEGPLKAIRADNGTLAWTYKNPWGVTMIFSETNGVLYLKTGDGFIVALRASDGKLLWHVRPIAPPFTVGMLWIEGNTVYTSTEVGNATATTLIALRLRDGKSLWQRKINVMNNMILPQVSDEQLLFISGNTVTALHAQDGVVNWHVDNVQTDLQDGMPFDIAGNIVILYLSSGALEVHQLETGAVLWRYPR